MPNTTCCDKCKTEEFGRLDCPCHPKESVGVGWEESFDKVCPDVCVCVSSSPCNGWRDVGKCERREKIKFFIASLITQAEKKKDEFWELAVENLEITHQDELAQAEKRGYDKGKSHYLAVRYFGEQKLDVIIHETKEYELKCKQLVDTAKAQGFKEAVEMILPDGQLIINNTKELKKSLLNKLKERK